MKCSNGIVTPWDGEELFIYSGMLVYVLPCYHSDQGKVALAEFLGPPHGDVYIISQEEYDLLPSPTEDEMDGMGV